MGGLFEEGEDDVDHKDAVDDELPGLHAVIDLWEHQHHGTGQHRVQVQEVNEEIPELRAELLGVDEVPVVGGVRLLLLVGVLEVLLVVHQVRPLLLLRLHHELQHIEEDPPVVVGSHQVPQLVHTLCLLVRSHQVKRLLTLLLHAVLSPCLVVLLEELKQVLLLHREGADALEGELLGDVVLVHHLLLDLWDVRAGHVLHGH
mmetsp:Transcript_4810/g.4461  ORF Transcript_4810/g.4461 Transcript_4810/m.4461 type:complete len:202 (+) Transcript_4810:1531-2136(+)